MRANPRTQSRLTTAADLGGIAVLGAIFCFLLLLASMTTDQSAHTAMVAPITKSETASLTLRRTRTHNPAGDPIETSP